MKIIDVHLFKKFVHFFVLMIGTLGKSENGGTKFCFILYIL